VLLDLKILNGDMPLKFDKYVNNYTVEIKEDVTKLEIEYICNNDDLVTIKNNDNLDFGINHIFIEVVNNEEKNVYVLEIYKKRDENVFNEIKIESEIKNEEKIPNYVPIGLIVGGFFIILLTFWILFHKKK
jgi:hypothetical protein